MTLKKMRYQPPPFEITNAPQSGIEISSFQYKCIIEVYQLKFHREKLVITFEMSLNLVNSGFRPFSKMAPMKTKFEYPLCTYHKC